MNRVRLLTRCGRLPYSGKGVTVAVLDSGIYPHIDYADRIIGFFDGIRRKTKPYDDQGHGTHIAGIIGGDGRASGGTYKGMAPGCNLVALKVLDGKGNGEAEYVVEAIHRLLENKNRYRVRILNLSVGTLPEAGTEEKTSLVKAAEEAWDAGIVVVAAAGNNGPKPMSITTPGISRKVITVGSSERDKTDKRGEILEGASSRGPTPFCIRKPEILAPGKGIISCRNAKNGYVSKTGTSMATAVVSGAIALLLEKYPYLSPAEVKLALYHSAVDLGWDKNRQGWGALDVSRLLNREIEKIL